MREYEVGAYGIGVGEVFRIVDGGGEHVRQISLKC